MNTPDRLLRFNFTHSPVLISSLLLSGGLGVVALAQDTQRHPDEPIIVGKQAVQISQFVREVFQDRAGDLWFGTNGDGVCRYQANSLPLPPLSWFSVGDGFGGAAVRGIDQDPTGAMWFATDGGVTRYDEGAFTNYTAADGLSDNSVWSMMLDAAGTLWVGTHEGVCRFDGDAFAPFPLPRVEVENPTSRFTPKVVFCMFEDQAGTLWFGTDGEGVHAYDGTSFTSYTAKDGLASNQVRSIQGDRDGRIWIGTDGGGVSCFDGTTFQNFTKQDGLNNDRIYEILEDSAGNMWFSTLGAGACRYDGTDFTPFGVDQGLTINELPCPCGSGSRYRNCHGPNGGHVQEILEDKDGVLWFGCSGGLFRLEEESFVNVTRDGPWPNSAQEPTPSIVANPMSNFARMVGGEWRVTYDSGSTMCDTWHWGPGKHSMRVVTDGFAGSGEPWRELLVFYWHPARKAVCLLGLSPYMKGVSEGTMQFDGATGEAVFVIHQGERLRSMGLEWTFDGPDRYDETLLEAVPASAEFGVLNGPLEFNRFPTRTTPAPPIAPDEGVVPKPSQDLQVLAPIMGGAWERTGEWVTDGDVQITSTLEWVPYADYIHVRSSAATEGGKPTHLLDAYIYHHNGTGRLRCLALSNGGGVYDGAVTVLDGGSVQLDMWGFEGDFATNYVVRLDFGQDGTLRDRVWSVEGDVRTLILDLHHRKIGSKTD
jgi:hypothetical protein